MASKCNLVLQVLFHLWSEKECVINEIQMITGSNDASAILNSLCEIKFATSHVIKAGGLVVLDGRGLYYFNTRPDGHCISRGGTR